MEASQRPSITRFYWLAFMSLVLSARTSGVRAFVRCHLLPVQCSTQQHRFFASVTGSIYEAEGDKTPRVTLFTKEGCTLCDKVKDVLEDLREEFPHSLDQVDITDDAHKEWFGKYKYDIPVLHMNNQYWLKHRTTIDEARAGLEEALQGNFQARSGEPNAEKMEHK